MNCARFRDRIHELHRGADEDERPALEQHTQTCASCASYRARCSELTCREFVEFLHDYLDAELAPQRHAVFERHLSACPDCKSYLDSYRRTMELGVAAFSELGSREIPEPLIRAILQARKRANDSV